MENRSVTEQINALEKQQQEKTEQLAKIGEELQRYAAVTPLSTNYQGQELTQEEFKRLPELVTRESELMNELQAISAEKARLKEQL